MKKSKTISIKAVPKPRQTRSDKWKTRPSVVRYRAFADELRLKFGKVPDDVVRIEATVHIKMPDAWSRKKKAAMLHEPHQQLPDWDNIAKAICDSLWPDDDSHIAGGSVWKVWAEKDEMIIELF